MNNNQRCFNVPVGILPWLCGRTLFAHVRSVAAIASLFGALATTSQVLAQGTPAPTPPLAGTPEWNTWYENLLAARLDEVPLARSTTRHFAQNGSDSTGDGSAALPWRTLVKAQNVLTAAGPTANLALVFRRGDTWREQVGIESFASGVTIADWGNKTLPKPIFTAFVLIGSPSQWAPTVSTNRVYQRAANTLPVGENGGANGGQPVTWVKEDDDRGNPYSRQQSIAGVDANIGSFWFDQASNTLYIHPKHVNTAGVSLATASDPRTDGKNYAFVRPTGAGIVVRGDSSRVENMVCEGWGMGTGTPTQSHGIDSRVNGTARAVIVASESYYGSSHNMTHAASGASGGITTFVGCRAGLCNINSAGETIFNSYAMLGQSETIWESCVAAYGTLPSSDWPFATTRRGQSLYAHSGGELFPLKLLVVRNFVSEAGMRGCINVAHLADTPQINQLGDARAFIVNEVHPGGPGGVALHLGGGQYVRIGGTYLNQKPLPRTWSLLNSPQVGWAINNLIDIDATEHPWRFALFNGLPGRPSTLRLIGNTIRVRTGPTTEFAIDYDSPTQAPQGFATDNTFIHVGSGSAIWNFGSSATVSGNSFYGFTPSAESPWLLAGGLNQTAAIPPTFAVRIDAEQPGNLDCLADIVGGDGNPPADGNVDGNDFQAFLNAFGAGC